MQKKMPNGGQNEQNLNNDAANVQERQYKRMTTEPVSRVVLSMGIPAVIGMLVTSIYNSADTYFVGQLGTSASGAAPSIVCSSAPKIYNSPVLPSA